VSRPVLLDLFSGAGGAAKGYHDAGFDVIGVDINPQPRYPFRFVQGDALDVLAGWDLLPPFDAIHASPPCRDHSSLSFVLGKAGSGHLLAATRRALIRTGKPYVIENVEGAEQPGALTLCGTEFGLSAVDQDGEVRWLKRHRQFESNVFLIGAGGCNCLGRRIGGVYGGGGGAPRTQVSNGGRRRGGYQMGAEQARAILGVPWMNRYEAAQAIPPAYTQFIGEQLLAHLAADPRPGPGRPPTGPTHPTPTHPPSMPPPAPVPAKTSTDVPARTAALVEAASMRRHAGTPARAGDLRGDLARAGTQTPAVVVGSGGGGT
jgi:DNA (cytosine-5)-methyltransferase 1